MKIQSLKFAVVGALGSLFLLSTPSFARPGEGIHVSDWTLRPYVVGHLEVDDNVRLDSSGEESDTSLELEYGMEIGRDEGAAQITGRFWGRSQRYEDLDGLDHDDFGDEILLSLETDGGTLFELLHAYSDVEDVQYQSASIESFEQQNFALAVTKDLTDKLSGIARYRFRERDYDTDDLFDTDYHRGRLDLARVWTGKSDVYVAGELGQEDSDGNSDEATTYKVLIGLQTLQTDKLAARVGAGVVGANSDIGDYSEFGVEAEIDYAASEKITFHLGAEREIHPAAIDAENFHLISTVNGSVIMKVIESIQLTLGFAFLNFDLQETFSATGTDKEEDIVQGLARLDYFSPGNFLDLFVEVRHEEQDSTVAVLDYDQTVTSFGVKLIY